MKRPDKTIINGLVYTHEWTDVVIGDDMTALYGQCLTSEMKLQVSTRYPLVRQQVTLLHETLHAIAAECLPDDLEESTVKLLAHALFAWMQYNPKAIRWIIDREEGQDE